MSAFLDGYIECALWSECGDSGAPLDHRYGRNDIAAEALETMRADCDAFVRTEAYRYYAGGSETARRAGIDFWLTRNGHGAGFWDGDWGDVAGRVLTTASKGFGECSLYEGDDGKLYCGG
jgi:hypothetical protein